MGTCKTGCTYSASLLRSQAQHLRIAEDSNVVATFLLLGLLDVEDEEKDVEDPDPPAFRFLPCPACKFVGI